MRLVLLVLLWAVPLSAGTQLIAVAGEIAAPRLPRSTGTQPSRLA